jgi:hypothetical protein
VVVTDELSIAYGTLLIFLDDEKIIYASSLTDKQASYLNNPTIQRLPAGRMVGTE